VLRWVGYEASAYSVAKTEVVAEMMRSGAAADHILQVSTLPSMGTSHPPKYGSMHPSVCCRLFYSRGQACQSALT
jgi:hypothetical protein